MNPPLRRGVAGMAGRIGIWQPASSSSRVDGTSVCFFSPSPLVRRQISCPIAPHSRDSPAAAARERRVQDATGRWWWWWCSEGDDEPGWTVAADSPFRPKYIRRGQVAGRPAGWPYIYYWSRALPWYALAHQATLHMTAGAAWC
jgi:hypothetical protein